MKRWCLVLPRVARSSLILGWLLGILIPLSSSSADNLVDYHGVKLVVTGVSKAGAGLSKVDLGGRAFLVADALAGQRTVLQVLSSPELARAIQPDVAREVLLAAARHEDAEVLQAAVPFVMSRKEWVVFDRDEAWSGVAQSESARTAMQQAVTAESLEDSQAARRCAVVAALLAHPRTPPVERWVLVNGEGCFRRRLSEMFAGLGAGFDYMQADAYLAQQAALWLKPGSDQERGVARLRETVRFLREAAKDGDDARFVSSLNDLADRGRECGAVVDARVQARLLESFVVVATQQQRYGSVIRCALSVDLERRTPALHSAFVQALIGIDLREADSLLTAAVVERLSLFAGKDDELATHLDLLLQRLARLRLDEARLDDARGLIESGMARGYLADSAWTSLGEKMVKLQLKRGDFGAARAILQQIGSRCSSWLRFRVAIAPYGVAPYLLLTVLCAAPCSVWLWRRMRPGQRRGDQMRSEPAREPPEFKEYCELLKVFGLSLGVEILEIKNAYRAAVKEMHPDAQGLAQSGDATEFIRLTAAYDRLVTLHKLMEGNGARAAPP